MPNPRQAQDNSQQELSVGQVIAAVAQHYHVDPNLALAQAWNESGLSPTAAGDPYSEYPAGVDQSCVYDGDTSFGLYQLHCGGELGDLSATQAFNPLINAEVALSHLGSVQAQNPDLSPGQQAAIAGGPSDPGSYAVLINGYYNQIKSRNYPPGFVAAYDRPSGILASSVTTGSSAWELPAPAVGSTASNSGQGSNTTPTATAANTPVSSGFLHTLQSLLNPGLEQTVFSLGASNVAAYMLRLAIAGLGVVIIGGGLVLLFIPIGGGVVNPVNRAALLGSRLQRLTQTGEVTAQRRARLSQSQQRIQLQQQRQQALYGPNPAPQAPPPPPGP